MKPTTSEYIEVRESCIHNNGIFASKNIPKGTKIIQYIGEKITKSEANRRGWKVIEESKNSKTLGAVYIFILNNKTDIDGYVPYNTARYINHSCSPNCETEIINKEIWIMALRDIKNGEELSYNYGYEIEDYEDHPCKCGSNNCVGYIVAEYQWSKLKKVLRKKSISFL